MKTRNWRSLAYLTALVGLALPACGDDGGQTDEAGSSDDGNSTDDGNDPTGNDTTGDPDDTTGDPDDTTGDPDDTTGDPDDTGTDTTGGPAQAQVRVIHGSPDAPAVDVYVDGSEVLAGVTYAQVSAYLELDPGEYDIAVYVSPADTSGDPVVAVEDFAVAAEEVWTVAALGSAAEGAPAASALRLAAFQEEFDAPGSDEVQVRVVHGIGDAPTVDVDLYTLGAGQTPACSDPPNSDITGLDFGNDSGAAGVALPADVLNVALCIDNNNRGVRNDVFRRFTIDLTELGGQEVFLFADGLAAQSALANNPASARLLAATGETTGDMLQLLQDPVVYLLHAAPDVGPVDVCAGGQQLINALPYAGAGAGGFTSIGAFPLNAILETTLHPDSGGQTCNGDGVPFPISGSGLLPGAPNLVVATGLIAGGEGAGLQQRIYTDILPFDPSDGNGSIRAVHMSPDTPEVDVGAAGVGFGIFPDLEFLIPPPNDYASDASAPTDVAAGTYDIQAGVSEAQGEDADAAAVTFPDVAIGDGTRAMAIVAGMLAPSPTGSPLSLIVINMTTADGSWTKAVVNPAD